jgi:hypothetical protein
VIQLPKSWRSNFAVWSSGNWTAAGYPSGSATAARQAAEQRWDDLVANMDVSRPSSGTSAAILVTPRNPAAMVAGILQEAVMMRRAWGTAQHLLGASPPPPAGPAVSAGMSYLYYHAGVENMQAILARALVAVMDTSGMRYSALRGKILSDVVIGSDIARMRPVTNMSDAAARPVLLQAWPKLAPWLQVNDHLTLLSDFVETVDGNTWRSWTQHRGNLSRYNRLLDYYQRVTAP